LLNNLVGEGVWKRVEVWIRDITADLPGISIIGSGGNINKLHKMSGRREGEPLSYRWIKSQYHYLEGLSYEERITVLGLNPDRADVIIPATRIFMLSAKWSHVKKIHVPKIGLSDGIIKTLYYSA
jgi:exopolyphosphatase/guanosine-5'-triphosphate,3'-diphosphate pyrophosphatase